MACPPQGKIPKTMCKKKPQSFIKVGFLIFGTCVASAYNFFQSIVAFFFMQSSTLSHFTFVAHMHYVECKYSW
jgi:hypothetical protein